MNWVGDTLPDADDDVEIGAAFSGVTVTSASDVSINQLTSEAALEIAGDTFSIATTSTVNNALTLSTGTLEGPGDMIVTGLATWTAGTMTGSGQTIAQGGLEIGDGYYKYLDGRTLVNQDMAVMTGTGSYRHVYFSNGVLIRNEAGATFDFQSDADFDHTAGAASTFENAGMVRKSAGTGTTTIDAMFDNTGTVQVQSGTLKLTSGGESSGGFDLAAGSTLQISSGTYSLGAGATAFGTGVLVVTGGTLTASANDIDLANLNLSAGTLDGSGEFVVSGVLSWTGGTMAGSGQTIAQGGLEIADGFTKILDGRTLVNVGMAVMTGAHSATGIVGLSHEALIRNEAGATFDFQSDAYFAHSAGAVSTFENAGTVRKSAGTETSSIDAMFHNTGTLQVQSGTLSLTYGGSSDGSFAVNAGATLEFGGGTHSLGAGSQVTGAGQILFSYGTSDVGGTYAVIGETTISGGTANFSSAEAITTATLTQTGGTLTGSGTVTVTGLTTWTGGTMAGSGQTIAQGGLEIADGFTKILDGRTLVNVGMAVMTGAHSATGIVGLSHEALIRNEAGATFDFQSDAYFAHSAGAVSTFENAGTVRKSAGTETSSIDAMFHNTGTLQVQSGTLSLTYGGSSDGRIDVGQGAVLSLANTTFDLSRGNSVSGPGTVVLSRVGSASAPQYFEVMSRDDGNVPFGFGLGFPLGGLFIESSSYVQLVDNADNSAGAGAECLYVDGLTLASDATLDLNLLHVYARSAGIGGTVLGGSVNPVPEGSIGINTPTSGAIAVEGEVDEWTFFGRAGRGITVIANPGTDGEFPAFEPTLDYADIRVFDPSGNIVATGSSSSEGEIVTLLGIELAEEGVFRIQVDAPALHPTSRGFTG